MYVNLTLSVEKKTVEAARRKAEALGTSVNALIREYLEQLGGKSDHDADAAEIERLSYAAKGNSRGWKFDREELHKRG